MQVVLKGEADRAVHLMRDSGGDASGLARSPAIGKIVMPST